MAKKAKKDSYNASMLKGPLEEEGFDLWYHAFWGINTETGEEQAFFIEFLRLNPAINRKKKSGPILEKNSYSFAMVRAGLLGPKGTDIAEFFGEKDCSISKRILSLRFGSNICLEDSTRGTLVQDVKGIGARFGLSKAGSVSWELKIQKPKSFQFRFIKIKLLHYFKKSRIFWDINGLKALAEGRISFDDQEYQISATTSFGYQDKLWGTHFPKDWFKIYAGALYDVKTGQLDQQSAFVFNRTENRANLGFAYGIVLNYQGKTLNFSSVAKKKALFCKFNETFTDDELIIEFEVIKKQYKIMGYAIIALADFKNFNYPTPQSTNFNYKMGVTKEFKVDFYKSTKLVAWNLIKSYNIKHALVHTNHCFDELNKPVKSEQAG